MWTTEALQTFDRWKLAQAYINTWFCLQQQLTCMQNVTSDKSMNTMFSSTLTFSSKNTDANFVRQAHNLDVPNNNVCPVLHQSRESISPLPLTRHKSPASSISSRRHIRENQHNMSAITDTRSNYESIERILNKENANLKMQNQHLLSEVNKLRSHNRRYREIWRTQKLELEQAREECLVQRARADQMKQIIMTRLISLEAHLDQDMSSECQSILEALTQSQREY